MSRGPGPPFSSTGGFPVNVATGGSVTSGNNSINQFLDQAGVTVSAGGSLMRTTNNATVHIEGLATIIDGPGSGN